MNKHTPGPWKAETHDREVMSKHFFIDCSGQAHDWLYVSRDGEQPVKVTADQAAAAPELLEALDRFVKYTRVRTMETASLQEYANLQVLVGLAEEVIVKVEGRV